MGNSSADSIGPSTRLLTAGETPPYSVRNPGASSPILLIGDHAGREIPAALNGLDLPAAALGLHIASDIGVAALGARLADALGATFIAQRYSRLVIDCNRDPARPDAIAEVSDGVAVPGNASLSHEARTRRIEEIFEPYHARIADEIATRRQAGRPTILLALHSFTPVMAGAARPWRFGVLHLGGSRFSDAMLLALRQALGADLVGDNEPYRMDGTDYTVPRHAIAGGLDYLELEVRQDLIAEPAGQAEVAALLFPLLQSQA
ncbi:MAG: N-formylglutamate amidohydrolase [Caulobacteraceae bacterium]